jgi:O-antigen ligase
MSKKPVKKSVAGQSAPQFDPFNQLLVVVIAATVTIFPFIFDSFTVSKVFVLAIGLSLIFLRFIGRKNLSGTRKLPILLSYLCTFFVLAAAFSQWNSGVPLLRGLFGQFGRGNGLFYYLFVILIFVFAVKTFKSTSVIKMHSLITQLSWFMVIYATLQRLGIDIAKLDTRELSPVVLTFGNSNFAGAMLSVLFAYQFTYAILKKSSSLYHSSLLIALVVTTIFTGAVQGYLIILFVIFLGASIFVVQKYHSVWVFRGVLIAWGIGIMGILLGILGKSVFADIFSRNTFQVRIEYWKVTLEIIKDYPLFGVGPDKLFDITASYMSPGSLKIITATRMDNAHNWFLNLGANYGLITLFFLLSILGYVFYRMFFLFRNLANSNPIAVSASVGFVAMFLDGLVSLEQPGLGVWMYIFGGVTVATALEFQETEKNQSPTDLSRIKKTTSICLVVALSFSSLIIGNRVIFDGILRSNVQTALLNQGSQQTFMNIESASIKLNSEPEYSVQALKPLAAIGDEIRLDKVSEAIYQYYPNSIQANLIRADVLRALNRNQESCPLRSTLISNSPWDISQEESYLVCIMNGYVDSKMSEILKRTQSYWEPIDTEYFPIEINEFMKAIRLTALSARRAELLGDLSRSESLKGYGKKLIIDVNKNYSQNLSEKQQLDLSVYVKLLSY